MTAEGNRREYHLATTWLPHLATNTLSLLLPDVYRLVARPGQKYTPATRLQPAGTQPSAWQIIGDTLAAMLHDNPSYVWYVAPLAFGYLLSAPWLNIYKGELAEQRLAGFGLDALPHASTAFALTALVRDTARAAGNQSAGTELASYGHWIEQHQTLISALVLALATLGWELGEYRIHRHELARRGSAEAINMQWSVADTAYDCASNVIGWLIATAWDAGRVVRSA